MEKERDLFSVGELTRALRITRRTLLYYEEFGLIRPDVRDGATGNRYYTIDTLVKLRTIRVLQNLGLSLSEIREYFDSAFELPPLIRRLESLRDELNRQIEGLQERSNAEPAAADRVPPCVYGTHRRPAGGAAPRHRAGGDAALRHGPHEADVPRGVPHRPPR